MYDTIKLIIGGRIMNKVISINIKKKEDYVSKFNDNSLSRELSEYIMEEYKSFNIRDDFYIEISSKYEMDDEERDNIASMIRSNFGTEVSEMLIKRKRIIYFDIITIILAVIALMFYLVSSDIPILSEFILIFSWVLIWESAYDFMFGRINNKIDIERRKRLTTCKIIFK